MNIGLHSRIILLVVLASLLSSTNTPALCIGSPLVLRLEVTNISQTDVEISEARMWMQFSYTYLDNDTGGGMGINHGGGIGQGGGSREKKLVLSPGMSYQSTHEFPLDFDFFQEAGAYTLETALDSVYSNDVKFEIYDCGKPQKVEEQK